jgi:hypothetical protein
VLMNTAPLELSPLYGTPGQGGLAASHYWPDKVGLLLFPPNSLLTHASPQTSPKSATR